MDYIYAISKHLFACFIIILAVVGSVFFLPENAEAKYPCPDDGCTAPSGLCYNGEVGKYCDINDKQECEEKDC